MTKKTLAFIFLTIFLIGFVTFEQIYTNNALSALKQEVNTLSTEIENENLNASKTQIKKVISMWNQNEKIICLFVDFRDLENIGKFAVQVYSHLDNEDFELAKVECNSLQKAIDTFYNMISIDITNIL